jgi:hypothetical protein
MGTITNPYLSVVVVSRNDNRGSDMFRRTWVCLNGIISQMERFKIDSEVVLVDWLPPPNRPLLKDAYPWPDDLKYCEIRTVVVSPLSLDRDYEWTDDYSIRDLTPWNVGIRRSKGKFILSTVTDVLFSSDLINFISKKQLHEDFMYRIDRCDVNRSVLNINSLDEQLSYCENNIIDIYTSGPLDFIFKRGLPILHDKAPGDFMLFSRERWHNIHGFPEGLALGGDDVLLYMAHLSGAEQYVFKKPIRLYHIDHDSRWKKPSYVFLKKTFNKLRMPYYLSEIMAGVGCKFIPSKSCLDKANHSMSSREFIRSTIVDMVEERRSYVYNRDNWGLGDKQMEEFLIGS